MDPKINVVCSNEQCVVGTIPAEPMTLSRKVVWSRFQPVSADYQLRPTDGRDGDYFRCPRCGAPLAIEGAAMATIRAMPRGRETATPAVTKTREQIRNEVAAAQPTSGRVVKSGGPVPALIVLGHSRLEVRP